MERQTEKLIKKKKPIYLKWWVWIIIGVVAVIIIVTSSGSNGNKTYNEALNKALENFAETDYTAIDYDALARDADSHIGKLVKYRGAIVQIVTANSTYRINVDGNSNKPIWTEKAKGIITGSFLDDDMVDVWGVVKGQKSYTAVLGNKIYLPDITIIKIQKVDVNSFFEYTDMPFTVTEDSYSGMRVTSIESCAIKAVSFSYDGGYKIDFEIIGTLTGYNYLNLYLQCYDSKGVFLARKNLFASVTDGVKFKITDTIYIPKETAKIEFEKD